MADHSQYTNEELLSLFRQGSQAAYTEIYHRFKGVLHLHAYKKLGNFEEAKDAVQEVFVILWEKREKLPVSTNFSGYVYQILRNRILNLIASRDTHARHLAAIRAFMEQGHAEADRHLREQELTTMIEAGINEMPPKMREVFLLSRKSYLSHKEIAQELSISESTVKNQIKSALKLLRLRIGSLFSLFFLPLKASFTILLEKFF